MSIFDARISHRFHTRTAMAGHNLGCMVGLKGHCRTSSIRDREHGFSGTPGAHLSHIDCVRERVELDGNATVV